MKRARSNLAEAVDPITCEAEVIPGLESVAVDELRRTLRRRVTVLASVQEGLVPFLYNGDLQALLQLETVLAVYGVRHFAVPRPRALLGHAHFTALLSMVEAVRELHPPATFQTFRISAAGEESSVLVRLREMIGRETGLSYQADDADLLVRLRRPPDGSDGWEALMRLSPRPLSARAWRVCNLSGALNATVAQAMARMTRPHPDDFVLNLMCGSGTLLIERLAVAPARVALGCDTNPEALVCAEQNAHASGQHTIRLYDWDAGALPVPDACVDVVLSDLPFGHMVGSHAANISLYPRILREAARVTIGGGLFAAITHDMRLWESLIAQAADWTLESAIPIKVPFSGGHLHPRIYLLRRAP